MHKKLMTSALVAGALGLAASANAATIVYEEFDYADGALAGNNGGVGFDGAWTTGIDADGNAAILVAGNAANRSTKSGGAYASRSLSAASTVALTADNSTMWFSITYNGTGQNSNYTFALATQATAGGVDNSLASAGYGVGFSTVNSGGTGKMQSIVYNNVTAGTEVNASTAFMTKTDTYQFAVKVNFKSDGNMDEVFIFDISGLSEGATAPLEATALEEAFIDIPLASQQQLSVLNLSDGQAATVDDIRFGATFADVNTTIPVPEPTTTALIGLGGLALILRRRK